MAVRIITINAAEDAAGGGVIPRGNRLITFTRATPVVRTVATIQWQVDPRPIPVKLVNGTGVAQLDDGFYFVSPDFQADYIIQVTADALLHSLPKLSAESLDPLNPVTVAAWEAAITAFPGIADSRIDAIAWGGGLSGSGRNPGFNVASVDNLIAGRIADDGTDGSVSAARAALNPLLAVKADLVGGLIPTSQLPALAINDVFPVADQAAMLALTAQRGDFAIWANGRTFALSADTPSVLSAWIETSLAALQKALNLTDLPDKPAARAALDVYSTTEVTAALLPKVDRVANSVVTYANGLPNTETIPVGTGSLVKTYHWDASGNPTTCDWNFPAGTDYVETFTYDGSGNATGSTFAAVA